MLKKGRKIIIFALSLGLFLVILVPKSRFEIEQIFFDLIYQDSVITTTKEVDAVLASFPTILQKDLPHNYLEQAGLNTTRFKKLSRKKFYVLRKRDLYRKIAGTVRIRDVFPVDGNTYSLTIFSGEKLYWGIDPAILYKVVELRNILMSQDLDGDAFWVRYGHRHPALNEAVGGAPISRHISGDALDLVIEDINNDGKADALDKAIVLAICEKRLIGNHGGIGRYPWSQTIHIDLRGRRARWDSH
ncbi:MAG: D-Ala-D-Ala carboxypeptidase family metallohydrolase [Bacteroidota bacterium]